MKRMKLLSGIAALALSVAALPSAFALEIPVPAAPSTTTGFGVIPNVSGVNFGGTGIDTTQVQWYQNNGITLGLSATPRYFNPAVTNDGAGTFTAQAGGDILDGAPNYARWNFDLYVGGLTSGHWTVYFDTNPAKSVGGTTTSTGDFSNDSFFPFFTYPLNHQDSWNEGFFYLGGLGFDPTINGEYAIGLYAYNSDNREVGHTTILVDVVNGRDVPDSGSTLLMLGSAVMGLALLRRRFGK